MKVIEHLVYLGTIRGVAAGEARKRAAGWLERLELADWATHKVEDLSKGMQQKVQLIGTLLHRPRLLILDEPFSGLDPINTRALKDLLLAMAADVLPQVDEMCTHICLINRARQILTGPLDAIRADYGGNVWQVHTDLGPDVVADLPGVTSVSPLRDDLLVELGGGSGPRELMRQLVAGGNVDSFTRFVPDLENIFIRAVEGDRSSVA
jgi:ABC-2 type transport system ATP-binding protein